MDQKQIIAIATIYADQVRTIFSPRQIILYGSYASGAATENSDIDIAVIVDRFDGDYLEQLFQLYKLRRNVDDRIEPILLISDQDPSGFLREVRKTGKVVFEAA